MQDLNTHIPNPYLFQSFGKGKKLETSVNSTYTLTSNWEVIDENLENFDVFNDDFSVDVNTKINKYQGLMSFAKYVEQNERKDNPSWMFSFFKPNTALNSLNSPLKLKPKTHQTNASNLNFSGVLEEEKTTKRNFSSPSLDTLGKSTYYKTNNFNILFPPRLVTRRNSDELTYYQREPELKLNKSKRLGLKRKASVQALSTFNNLVFLDQITHEYMSNAEFSEEKAEQLRRIKLVIQEIFKDEQLKTEEFIGNSLLKSSGGGFVKPRRIGPWGELWEDKALNLAQTSPYGHFPSYQLRTMIVKGGDDLRQELIAMQMISQIHQIFRKAELNIYLRPYDIIVTSANSGIIGN